MPTTVVRREPKRRGSRELEIRDLCPENARDVREFRKRLHKADFDMARRLLKLLYSMQEILSYRSDPKRIEEMRIRMETMDKGVYREGTGWVWNGHTVPAPPSTAPYFERRKRIIQNGVWSPARKGWEYQGEFFGVWE